MIKIITILVLIFISGCGNYYTTTNYIERNYIPNNSGFFDPSGAYEWKLFNNKGKLINSNSQVKDDKPKIMKVQIYLNDKSQISYLWYGSIDPEHSNSSDFTSLTPTNFIYLVNLAELNKEYTIETGSNNNGGMICQDPFRTKDETNYISVDKNDRVKFIKLENYYIDKDNSFQYTKDTTSYGLYGGSMYSGTLKFSVDRTYKRLVLKAYSKDKSEINFDSHYIQVKK